MPGATGREGVVVDVDAAPVLEPERGKVGEEPAVVAADVKVAARRRQAYLLEGVAVAGRSEGVAW